jgi:hypothetical protein
MTPASALRPGDQLASTVCTTRVVVIRAPRERQLVIACDGRPMVPGPVAPSSSAADAAAATLIGKRYVDASETVELLCTSSGVGVLSCDGAPMTVKAAKPLPASD